MTVRELVRSAVHEIAAYKARSAFTCLSLSIGIAAMLFTFSSIQGMSERFHAAIDLAGPGRLKISAKEGYVSRGRSQGLSASDAEAIRRSWPELNMVYPLARRQQARMSLPGFSSKDMEVKGTTPEWRKRDWVYALRGRFLNEEDVRSAARVCLLIQPGTWRKKPVWARFDRPRPLVKLLSHRDLLGKEIQLEDHLFKVVGILQEPHREDDHRWFREWGGDGTVVVPVSVYKRYFVPSWRKGDRDRVDGIEVDTGDETTSGLYMRRIEGLLSARHRGEKDFEIKDFRQVAAGAMQMMRKFAAAVLVIGIVAVLASGIGIMNVTLATIFSRIREIGIRRALGATRADIVWQFVTEAMVLGIFGGLAGSALGAAAVIYLAPKAERMASLSLLHVAGALAISLATGFLFSIFPAFQASKFDPVEALRYE